MQRQAYQIADRNDQLALQIQILLDAEGMLLIL